MSTRGPLTEVVVAERDLVVRRVIALTEDFDAIVASTDLVSTDDEHDPDGSTIAFERAMVAALLAQARAQCTELEAALRGWMRGPTAGASGAARPSPPPDSRSCPPPPSASPVREPGVERLPAG